MSRLAQHREQACRFLARRVVAGTVERVGACLVLAHQQALSTHRGVTAHREPMGTFVAWLALQHVLRCPQRGHVISAIELQIGEAARDVEKGEPQLVAFGERPVLVRRVLEELTTIELDRDGEVVLGITGTAILHGTETGIDLLLEVIDVAPQVGVNE